MLKGLRDIPWAELSHGYGSAEDVPDMLEALIADDEGRRQRAIFQLFCTIYHQGTVYQASAYAVPFLIELLMHETVQGKDDILALLADLAGGDGYIHQHLPLSQQEPEQFLEDGGGDTLSHIQASMAEMLKPENFYGPDYQQYMDEELFWVKKTHRAVVEGANYYFSLLEHPNLQMKMNAVILLARLPEHAERVIPLLYTLFDKEDDVRLKGNLVFVLGMLDRQSTRNAQFLRELALGVEGPLLQFVAALLIVASGREDIPYETINLLIQVAMGQIHIDEESYNQIPTVEWRPASAALKALPGLTRPQATYAIQQLLSAFDTYVARFEEERGCTFSGYTSNKDFLLEMQARGEIVTDNNEEEVAGWMGLNNKRYLYPALLMIEEMCETLMDLAFGRKRIASTMRFHDLSSEQQRVLTTLLNCGLAWHCNGRHRDMQTWRWIDTITCVAGLNAIGLLPKFHGTWQKDELRFFIHQHVTIAEEQARHQRQWQEEMQRAREQAIQRRKADMQ